MDAKKREKLERAGWKVGDIDEFLGLSEKEMGIIHQMTDPDCRGEVSKSDN